MMTIIPPWLRGWIRWHAKSKALILETTKTSQLVDAVLRLLVHLLWILRFGNNTSYLMNFGLVIKILESDLLTKFWL